MNSEALGRAEKLSTILGYYNLLRHNRGFGYALGIHKGASSWDSRLLRSWAGLRLFKIEGIKKTPVR